MWRCCAVLALPSLYTPSHPIQCFTPSDLDTQLSRSPPESFYGITYQLLATIRQYFQRVPFNDLMETLNADCLSHIFLNLDFVERVRLEAVCQMWYYVLQDPASFSDMTDLNIAKFLSNTTCGYYQQESISFVPTVLGIVERCGAYVRRISFDSRWLKISQPIVESLASHCKQLRVLDLGGTIIAADLTPLIQTIADNLEELSLEDTSWVDHEHAEKLPRLFARFRKLRKVNFRTAMFKLNRIYELPSSLRAVQLSAAKRFPADDFSDFLITHKDLEDLNISPTPAMDQSVIFHTSQLPQLRHLAIGYVDLSADDIPMECLAELTNLTSLHLQSCLCINEMSLRLILSALTQLEELRIANCKSIFDYSALALCRNVTRLHIGETLHLANDDICAVANFQKLLSLSLSKCSGISTPAIQHILWRCHLRELLLYYCDDVTDEALMTLAHTQLNIRSISVQGCVRMTSKGVAALGHLHNLDRLQDVDISRNRTMDASALIALHTALAVRRQDESEDGGDGESKAKTTCRKKLTVYVFQTPITRVNNIEDRVGNLLDVVY